MAGGPATRATGLTPVVHAGTTCLMLLVLEWMRRGNERPRMANPA